MKDIRTTGERIHDLRCEKGILSQKQLCKEIEGTFGRDAHISTGTINAIENDKPRKTGYSHQTFIYLAKFFGVSTDYLFCLSDYKTQAEEIGKIYDDMSDSIRDLKNVLSRIQKYESEGLNNGEHRSSKE